MTHPMTSAIRTLDPAPSGELSRAENDLCEATLTRIVTDTDGPSRALHRRHSLRPWLVGLPAAAVLALTVGVMLSVLPGAAHPPTATYALPAHGSLASWTASPKIQPVSAVDLAACEAAIGIAPGESASVLTSDRRGDFTSLILQAASTEAFCVLADGEVVNWTNFASLHAHPLPDPNDASLSVMQGAGWMITVSGRAGNNVTGVMVHNPDTDEQVTATVADGVWSAWWPIRADSRANGSLFGAYGDEITITYTTSDGASHISSGYADSGDPSESGPSAPPALGSLAGWKAEPTAYTASAADVDACLDAPRLVDIDPPISPLLAERRGDFVTVVLTHAGGKAYCTLRDGVVQWSQSLGDVSVGVPAAGKAMTTDGSGVDGSMPGTRISTLRGVAGSDVVAVVIHLAGGEDVQASIENGVWLGWWPENEPAALSNQGGMTTTSSAAATASPGATAPANIPPISYTTRDGVTHDAP